MRCSKCNRKISNNPNDDDNIKFKNILCIACVCHIEAEASNPSNFSPKCLRCGQHTDAKTRVVVNDFRGVFCKPCHTAPNHSEAGYTFYGKSKIVIEHGNPIDYTKEKKKK